MAVFESKRNTGLQAALYQLLYTGCDEHLFEQWLSTDDSAKTCEEVLSLCLTVVPDVMTAQESLNDAFDEWKKNLKVSCYCKHEEFYKSVYVCEYCSRKYCVSCAQTMLDVDADGEYICAENCGALYS